MEDLTENNYVFAYAGQKKDEVALLFGESVERIPNNLFNPGPGSTYSPKIVCIQIGDNVQTIGEGAFRNCVYASKITITENVRDIGSLAFGNCVNLTELNFNAVSVNETSSVTHIFGGAGENNTEAILKIGDKVSKIGVNVFSSCTINKVYITNLENWCNI
jgi:hypothetical protein